MADSPEEKAHWREVIQSFDGYMQYHLSANHARRMAFLSLSKDDKAMYEAIGFRDKLEAVDEGIRRNAEFIDELIADPVFADMLSTDEGEDGGHGHSHVHSHGHGHSHGHDREHSHAHDAHASASTPPAEKDKAARQADMNLAQDKIRSTLRSFVRDWSVEGQVERDACYTPILSALEGYFGADVDRAGKKVLVPGTGLGRLAMEIAAKGFSAQGNEFSTYMLIASNYILNQTSQPFAHEIFPYLHSFSNHLSTENHLLQKVLVPDIVPAEALAGKEGEFSLVAGDFEEVYGGEEQKGQWAAVTTCFFIDCARNVLSFLRIIYDLLEPGGVWINLGPLLWHFENSPTKSAKGEGSIELSLDEVKALARNVGFEISDERMVRSSYTGIPEGMLRHEYTAAFWTATKRKI